MAREHTERQLGRFADLVRYLSEVSGTEEDSGSVGIEVKNEIIPGVSTSLWWARGAPDDPNNPNPPDADIASIPFPMELYDQDFVTKGPCPLSGRIVYFRADTDKLLAWCVSRDVISEEESLWIRASLVLRAADQ